ncbi:trypsin eta [Drosophila grimshawi]|uniref:GH17346 n=1 Tax=Drosophila grimshawi TaxID=7222 RepID=B4JUU6_DROGR|nr:trypsin eta [Drosophila grimshawi]EDV91266.1 GH17346 [Drosophila grimshawi]
MLSCEVLRIVFLCLTVSSAETYETHAKIVGGYLVNITDAPYMVSIRIRAFHEEKFGLGHICGGTVISQRVICTAAHCFAINDTHPVQYRGPEHYVVVAGSRMLDQVETLTQVYLVQEIIGHDLFHPLTLENDIALMFLNSLIPYQYLTIRSLPLTEKPYPENTKCFISGWGNNARELRQAVVPIVHDVMCNLIYIYMPQSQLCAGWLQGGIDACKGDSGGPLVCQDTLAGIISWGVDCGRFFFPGVYTNVSHFVDWIKWANASLDYSKYTQMRWLSNNCHHLHFNLKVFYSVVLFFIYHPSRFN